MIIFWKNSELFTKLLGTKQQLSEIITLQLWHQKPL